MPTDMAPAEYVQLYKGHLAPVKHLLGIGMGLRLQREDSDLALEVLNNLAERNVVALPIHDSFIVKRTDANTLRIAMDGTFSRLFGYKVIVK
jgi:hypothetical protein